MKPYKQIVQETLRTCRRIEEFEREVLDVQMDSYQPYLNKVVTKTIANKKLPGPTDVLFPNIRDGIITEKTYGIIFFKKRKAPDSTRVYAVHKEFVTQGPDSIAANVTNMLRYLPNSNGLINVNYDTYKHFDMDITAVTIFYRAPVDHESL